MEGVGDGDEQGSFCSPGDGWSHVGLVGWRGTKSFAGVEEVRFEKAEEGKIARPTFSRIIGEI